MDKTIYVTFDEASRLVDACKDSDGVVTKKFFDWYLGEPKFFAKTGILVIDNFPDVGEKTAVSFDFSDPDDALFVSYRYSDQKQICKFRFFRQENLTINNVSVEIIEYSQDVFTRGKKIICAPDTAERAKEIADEIALLERKRRLQKMKKTKREILVEMAMKRLYPEINKATCRAFVYYIYAMMYNFHNQQPEEFLSEGASGQADFNEKVKAIYRYSGYVNITDNKVYRPIVKKEDDEPTREYQRHIQKWIVRGHYRRTTNGLIWIDEHIKGQGELEKRVYGTVDESEAPIVPKVFEVFRAKRKRDTAQKKKQAHSTLTNVLSVFIDRVARFLLPYFFKKDSAKT